LRFLRFFICAFCVPLPTDETYESTQHRPSKFAEIWSIRRRRHHATRLRWEAGVSGFNAASLRSQLTQGSGFERSNHSNSGGIAAF
jgi:hypothetical protein